jgi:two-component system sensor histidine kinase TctE
VNSPLVVLLVWLASGHGIEPLDALGERVRQRKPDDVDCGSKAITCPKKSRPSVASFNELLTRLKDSIATQKAFFGRRTHQLKTPLAGSRMQADWGATRKAQTRKS